MDAFPKAKLIVEMSDIEKVYFKTDLSFEKAKHFAYENAKDMIAYGLPEDRTFFFNNSCYKGLDQVVWEIQRRDTVHNRKKIYGFGDASSAGMVTWPSYQMAPCFPQSFPSLFGGTDPKDIMCLVPCAVDQTPYFRHIHHMAVQLGCNKPAIIASKFLVSLAGVSEKMSATGIVPSILMNDTPKIIANKINKHAFSGGQATIEEQRTLGADLMKDVSYQYLNCFLDDYDRLNKIGHDYANGEMLTGEVKKILIDVLVEITANHQKMRATITKDVLKKYYSLHYVEFPNTDLD
jgi:tryptophanyl-tRNA synthetase